MCGGPQGLGGGPFTEVKLIGNLLSTQCNDPIPLFQDIFEPQYDASSPL